jgi:sigma-54 dependent transcriptional regulator, acetoin dehydrogenase operon transcriptional activator AcoR
MLSNSFIPKSERSRRRSEPIETCQGASALTTTDDEEPQESGPCPPQLAWCLTIAHHERPELVGLRKVLPSGTSVVLGRGSSCMGPSVFDHSSISRNHTRISAAEDRIVVEDLDSRNGTWIDGARSVMASLTTRGVIGVGSTLLIAHRSPADYPAPDHAYLIGKSHALARVLDDIKTVAAHPTSVLICGESGSGKELVARAIHEASGRSGALRAVNCGALGGDLLQSEIFGHARGAFTGASRDHVGLLEASHRGTLFLDEIGEAPTALQVSLLRFLEDREVRPVGDSASRLIDTRIVAASHRNLTALIESGGFREDLFSRLSGWSIQVPPLRERIEDIPHLAAHVVRRLARQDQPIDPRLMLALLLYSWPRNVRELHRVVERAVIESRGQAPVGLSPAIEALLRSGPSGSARPPGSPEQEPASGAKALSRREAIFKPTRDHLAAKLGQVRGNIRELSTSLGVSRNTLYRWLREYAITVGDHRQRQG